MRPLFIAAFALSFSVSAIAQISPAAQYQWLDTNGQMVYSDQPPPATVPLSRVVRVGDPIANGPASTKTSTRSQSLPVDVSPSSGIPPESQAAQGQSIESPRASKKRSIREQMIAFEKRRAKRKANQRKRVQLARRAKANAQRCERLKANQAKLDSGVRLRMRDEAGEYKVMTEQERFTRAKAIAKRLKKCRA
ncbi:MAG: DUF4124 domain-containing protein [Burkholderiaceae bacterium]